MITIESLQENLIFAAYEVFNELGFGHSEVIYEAALSIQLHLQDIPNRRQVPVNVTYKGYNVGTGYIDLLVDERFVVELKSVAKLSGKDVQQARKYLTATGLDLGLLINYGQNLEFVEIRKDVTYDQTISTEDRN